MSFPIVDAKGEWCGDISAGYLDELEDLSQKEYPVLYEFAHEYQTKDVDGLVRDLEKLNTEDSLELADYLRHAVSPVIITDGFGGDDDDPDIDDPYDIDIPED